MLADLTFGIPTMMMFNRIEKNSIDLCQKKYSVVEKALLYQQRYFGNCYKIFPYDRHVAKWEFTTFIYNDGEIHFCPESTCDIIRLEDDEFFVGVLKNTDWIYHPSRKITPTIVYRAVVQMQLFDPKVYTGFPKEFLCKEDIKNARSPRGISIYEPVCTNCKHMVEYSYGKICSLHPERMVDWESTCSECKVRALCNR